jgi:hypothetical protein
VKLFNDFMESNPDAFSDMRMWHWDKKRSKDSRPGPIKSSLVRPHVFVFLGNRLPGNAIDYQKVLKDFDRLLPLYRYVESGGVTEPVPLPTKEGFKFQPGAPAKKTSARATIAEKELDLNLRHRLLQQALYDRLVAKHGKHNVRAEQPSGQGTLIDIVVQIDKDFWFYEIKTALTPRACLREAIGQLLEYGYWPGAQTPSRLIVVGETPIDNDGGAYLRRLKEEFELNIEYQSIKT